MSEDLPAADPAADAPGQALAADVVTYAGAPNECTLSPRDVTDDRATTAWITARGDAFVSVEEMR